MIRHIFVGTAKEDTTPEQLDDLLAAWRGLPSHVSEIRRMTAGRNISPRDQRYSVALVADFDDMDAWERYMNHPAHVAIGQRLTANLIKPDSRAVVQFIVEDA